MAPPYKKRKKGEPSLKNGVPVTVEVGDGAAIPRPDDLGLYYAWRIVFFTAIALMVLFLNGDHLARFLISLPWFNALPDSLVEFAAGVAEKENKYRLGFFFLVPEGLLTTFQVTCGGMAVALVLGVVAGLGRISKVLPVNIAASSYVEVVRGIPLLVQLFYLYYAIGEFVKFSPLASAVMALGFCYGAYMGEVIRGSIKAIDRGQMEAAVSLGFSPFKALVFVIFPQAMRTILPPIGNEFIALLKDSSLVSMVAVADIMRQAQTFGSVKFTFFEVYTMAALTYLLMTMVLSKGVSILEIRLSRYEQR